MALTISPNPLEYVNEIDSYGYDFSSMSIKIIGTNIAFGGPINQYESISINADNSHPEVPSTSPIVPSFGAGKAKFSGSFKLSKKHSDVLVVGLAQAGQALGRGAMGVAFDISMTQNLNIPGLPPTNTQCFGCFLTKLGQDDSQDAVSMVSYDFVCSLVLVNGSRLV